LAILKAMLRELSIRNIVLIDSLDLKFDSGLSVLTGETGAGKSILLDSIGLIIGSRADTTLISEKSDQAAVSASFEIENNHPANDLLKDNGLSLNDNYILLRRTLSNDGRSRAFINDQPATIALLKAVGTELIEIQGQFDKYALANTAVQRSALDVFGNLNPLVIEVTNLFKDWSLAQSTLSKAEANFHSINQKKEQIKHDFDELNSLSPSEGEETQINDQRKFLQNGERLLSSFNEAIKELEGDSGSEALIQKSLKIVEKVSELSGNQVDQIILALERASSELREAISELESLARSIETDTSLLETLEERLFELRSLARKHGTDVDNLINVRDSLSDQLESLETKNKDLNKLSEIEQTTKDAYLKACEHLSLERNKTSINLDDAVNNELPPLKLEGAIFKTNVQRLPEQSWSETGIDSIEFLVSTNQGNFPGPLGKIASGGELSRFLLALKVVLTDSDGVPTLIFDEVDSGIGGATASAVGQRLAALSAVKNRQVLVVTHSPQVAAIGNHHWRVTKVESEGKTITKVELLGKKQRREEIARMLAGAKITDEARAAAQTLIDGASSSTGKGLNP
jgi:DNA repair protein RecN (Recombination protein N)|tara:strand:+ start:21233 stop:22954 length:1722 start_codon:yes stop_codon:yes gene_type:complete